MYSLIARAAVANGDVCPGPIKAHMNKHAVNSLKHTNLEKNYIVHINIDSYDVPYDIEM